MNNIEAMKAELTALDEQSAELAKLRKDLRQRIANAQAEFKVGDRVTHDGAKHTWEITGIVPGYYSKPDYIGSKLKKDGTPSKVANRIYLPYGKSLRAA